MIGMPRKDIEKYMTRIRKYSDRSIGHLLEVYDVSARYLTIRWTYECAARNRVETKSPLARRCVCLHALLDFGAVATQNTGQGSRLNQSAYPFQKAY